MQKRDKSADIGSDRTTKVLTRFVEALVVPSKAFQMFRDVLTSGSERNTKKFFEKTCVQLFHIIYTMYGQMGQEEWFSVFELLCSMYPVNMSKIQMRIDGQEILAEVKAAEEVVDEIEPVAIKSKWAKMLHLRKRGEIVTLCGQKLANKDLRKRHDGLTICNRCQGHIHKEEEETESE